MIEQKNQIPLLCEYFMRDNEMKKKFRIIIVILYSAYQHFLRTNEITNFETAFMFSIYILFSR